MQTAPSAVAEALPAYRFPAEVHFANACALLDAAAPEIDSAQPRFDLSACERFDSSLLAILLELARRAGALGRRCELLDAPQNLRKLASLYGVDELLFGPLHGP